MLFALFAEFSFFLMKKQLFFVLKAEIESWWVEIARLFFRSSRRRCGDDAALQIDMSISFESLQAAFTAHK